MLRRLGIKPNINRWDSLAFTFPNFPGIVEYHFGSCCLHPLLWLFWNGIIRSTLNHLRLLFFVRWTLVEQCSVVISFIVQYVSACECYCKLLLPQMVPNVQMFICGKTSNADLPSSASNEVSIVLVSSLKTGIQDCNTFKLNAGFIILRTGFQALAAIKKI